MKTKEFLDLNMDTCVKIRCRKTGEFLKDPKDYMDKDVVGFYARIHKQDDAKYRRAEIIVFVRQKEGDI